MSCQRRELVRTGWCLFGRDLRGRIMDCLQTEQATLPESDGEMG